MGIFDETQSVPKPTWPQNNDIFSLKTDMRLYDIMLRQRSQRLSERALSMKMLALVKHEKYATLAASLEIAFAST